MIDRHKKKALHSALIHSEIEECKKISILLFSHSSLIHIWALEIHEKKIKYCLLAYNSLLHDDEERIIITETLAVNGRNKHLCNLSGCGHVNIRL